MLAVIRGDLEQPGSRAKLVEAREDYREAQGARTRTLPNDRAVQIRLLALETPGLAEPLQRYFEGRHEEVALLGLSEVALAHPDFGPPRYLIGLALAARGEPAWSMDELDKALAAGGFPDDLMAQALRMEIDDGIREERYHAHAAELRWLA